MSRRFRQPPSQASTPLRHQPTLFDPEPPQAPGLPAELAGPDERPRLPAQTPAAGARADGELFGPAPDEWEARLARARDLQALEAVVKGCTRCGLRAGCRQVVFGEGNPAARLMLVGEGPGQVEDETGRPFVGPAGQLLDRMLAAIGLNRSDVYIANVVKCRPPNNRVPTPEEAMACWPNLRRQLELIRPELVLCLGATAARQLVDAKGSVSALRGRWVVRNGVRHLVSFHPAALLRTPAYKALAWQDLQMVQKALQELPPKSHRGTW